MVRVNGMYKSGTHAGMKACALLGCPTEHHHQPYDETWLNGTPHIFMVRDPRNILVSYLRWSGQTVSPGMLLTTMQQFPGGAFLTVLDVFAGWLSDSRTFCLRYEALIASDRPMRDLADYLQTPYLDGAWEVLPGLTETWREPHADYREYWTPAVEQFWTKIGGPERLTQWGY